MLARDGAAAVNQRPPLRADAASGTLARCYHCDDEVIDSALTQATQGAPRYFCCPGCLAATETIEALGLAPYYRQREGTASRPLGLAERDAALALFDDPILTRDCVQSHDNGERTVRLLLEGLRCAACAWLIEQRLARVEGVESVRVDFAHAQAFVRWDPARLALPAVLDAVWALGYRAWPFDPVQQQEQLRRERVDCLRRFGIAALCAMQVMMVASAFYFDAGPLAADEQRRWLEGLNLLTTLPVVVWCAVPFYRGAWRALRHRLAGMDLPVSVGILLGFAGSLWHFLSGVGPTYFDSVTMFVTLLLGARYVDLRGQERSAVQLGRLHQVQPVLVRRLDDNGDDAREQQVLMQRLQPGDRVRVLPGEWLAVDGIVLAGCSSVDEHVLTGESRPVSKTPGARVLQGSVNLDSPLILQVTAVGSEAFAARMAVAVAEAARRRPPVAALAARVAVWFTGGVLLLALGTALFYAFATHLPWLPATVAVLVISCPCALSLATPAALAAATDGLLARGVALLRGPALETLADVTHVVFDKTGTLTLGQPALIRTECAATAQPSQVLTLAAALAAYSEHPLARALMAAAPEGSRPVAEAPLAMPGAGLVATVDGALCLLGSRRYAQTMFPALQLPSAALPLQEVCLIRNGEWLAFFYLADVLRPEARSVVDALRASGVRLAIFSGDRAPVVAALGAELGITDARAGLLPAEKAAAIAALQATGAKVAVVGEGVNDAPMLAGAAVSFALANATEQARLAADFSCMTPGLAPIAASFQLARRARRVLWQNLAWALGYNLLALPLAVCGWVQPWGAALCMSLSSLAVTINAQRLRRTDAAGRR